MSYNNTKKLFTILELKEYKNLYTIPNESGTPWGNLHFRFLSPCIREMGMYNHNSSSGERFPEKPPSFTWLQEVAIPLLQLLHIIFPEGNTNNGVCRICRENYLFGDVACDLRCDHRYHHPCIFEWATRQPIYPLCRVYINQALERRRALQPLMFPLFLRSFMLRVHPPIHAIARTLVHPIFISGKHISDSGGVHGGHYYAFIRPTLSNHIPLFLFMVHALCLLRCACTPCPLSPSTSIASSLVLDP